MTIMYVSTPNITQTCSIDGVSEVTDPVIFALFPVMFTAFPVVTTTPSVVLPELPPPELPPLELPPPELPLPPAVTVTSHEAV